MAACQFVDQLDISAGDLPGLIHQERCDLPSPCRLHSHSDWQAETAPLPEPPPGLQDAVTCLTIHCRNITPFYLQFQQNTYASKGVYRVRPQSVSPFGLATWTVVNKSDSEGEVLGVAGGNTWTLILDDSNQVDLSIVGLQVVECMRAC